MVGDRGMITSARIDALRAVDGLGWITSLRAPAIPPPWPTTGPCNCACSTTPTWPRSPIPTTPASDSSPAATPPSPPNEPANATNCWPPPRPSSTRSSPPSPPGGCATRPRSAYASAVTPTTTRWPNTSSFAITDGDFTYRPQSRPDHRRGRPRRDLHPAHQRRRRPSRHPRRRRRLQTPRQRRSRLPQPQDHRLGPPPHPPPDPNPACEPTCSSACSPPTSSGTSAEPGRRSASPTNTHPTQRPRRPRPALPTAPCQGLPATTTTGDPAHSFATLLDHLATLTRNTIVFTNAASASTSSPCPPPPNTEPSTSSTHRSTPPHVDRTIHPPPKNPLLHRGFTHSTGRDFGLERGGRVETGEERLDETLDLPGRVETQAGLGLGASRRRVVPAVLGDHGQEAVRVGVVGGQGDGLFELLGGERRRLGAVSRSPAPPEPMNRSQAR